MLNNTKSNLRLIVFIFLCAVGFFGFSLLGKANRVFELLGCSIILILVCFHLIYSHKEITLKKNFNIEIGILILSVILSSFSAKLFHEQAMWISYYQQRFMYYFFIYFLFHYLLISTKKLEEILIWIAIIHSVIFILQQIVYPYKIIEANVHINRGNL